VAVWCERAPAIEFAQAVLVWLADGDEAPEALPLLKRLRLRQMVLTISLQTPIICKLSIVYRRVV
jgi:hypothetical protein